VIWLTTFNDFAGFGQYVATIRDGRQTKPMVDRGPEMVLIRPGIGYFKENSSP
jgi:hypothetical protein